MTLFTLDNDRVRLQVAERGGAIEGYGGSIRENDTGAAPWSE